MKPNDPGRQIGGGHYGGTEFQHWDWVELNELGYQEGQISRYVLRWRKKEGVKDLDKAIHHTEKLIEQFTTIGRSNRSKRSLSIKETRTTELFNNMQTPVAEGNLIIDLMNWDRPDDLEDVRNQILWIKEKYLDQQAGPTGSSTAS